MDDLLAFQRELKARLSYPLVVVSAASIALSVLMLKVFPAMAGMWSNLGKPLPAKLEVIRVAGWIAIGFLVLLAGGMSWLMSGDERAQRIPGFRTLGRHRNRSELWSALGMALGGGVPLLEALALLGDRWGARDMRQAIQKGVRPEDALAQWVDDAPGQKAVLIASLRVGDLAGGAQNVAEGYRELLETDLKSLQRWLEPVILLLLGGILMALAWSLFSIMGEMEQGLVR
jgi:type II secretory pathway component PulF